MNTFEAVKIVVRDQYAKRRKAVDYRRVCRALRSLELTEDQVGELLREMEYHDTNGNAYAWCYADRETAGQ